MNRLFILAFDQRSSFLKLLGVENEPRVTQKKIASEAKEIIFEGFQAAIQSGKVLKENTAILVDEEFGSKVIEEARTEGYTFAVPVEASGKSEFEFQHGKNFVEHIGRVNPSYVKALVRYNPEDDIEKNKRQTEKLSQLSQFCEDAGREWLLEVLIDSTERQIKKVKEKALDFDLDLRPELQIEAIKQLQASNVNPNIWKIEGLENPIHYRKMVKQVHAVGDDKVKVVVLGRGADSAHVERWLAAAKGIDGITGFAIGRTIFSEPLKKWRAGDASRVQTAAEIAENYVRFCKIMKN